DAERIKHWLGQGAQLTDKVAVLYKDSVKSAAAPAAAA
ncbi:MAG: 30S ribosomal protein S16, partial [Pseudomonadota bacterium]|nr:30S ribosomal protein S16 [Pseudomonadota bacterium]